MCTSPSSLVISPVFFDPTLLEYVTGTPRKGLLKFNAGRHTAPPKTQPCAGLLKEFCYSLCCWRLSARPPWESMPHYPHPTAHCSPSRSCSLRHSPPSA